MVERVGIDAGGTFIKIAYYDKGERLHLKSYATSEIEETSKWIHLLTGDSELVLTGGKAGKLAELLPMREIKMVAEFEATCIGAAYLLQEMCTKALDRFVLVSIGTGTSIHIIDHKQFQRVIGSGIGGGMLMGLGKLLTGEHSFSKLVEMAKAGNRHQMDVLVSDIYSSFKSPISGDLTAANFGHAHKLAHPNGNDAMAALINFIAETIVLLATQVAEKHQMKQIVFVGGTLSQNEPLQKMIRNFEKLIGFEALFLKNGTHAGALGALLGEWPHFNNS
ncbi:type II pantothenate kinase [Bacillus chungangensis]|uniref:Type II pantothenate kinase n=1 Tax=Bacillus chungangensis TaxID=587633 RepID=A0ABT9WZ90_9BACI|nr:type II pantothenate kinase [Bacillus chungangensis]MDQ0178501.1 type II pantothenate kinase [Bacillus chungangensis]